MTNKKTILSLILMITMAVWSMGPLSPIKTASAAVLVEEAMPMFMEDEGMGQAQDRELIGLNLAVDAGETISSVTLRVNDLGTGFDPNIDLAPLSMDEGTTGVYLVRDTSPPEGQPDPGDAPVNLLTTPAWSGTGPWQTTLSLSSDPPTNNAIPTDDTGENQGPDYFVFLRAADNITTLKKFTLSIWPGDINLSVGASGINITTPAFSLFPSHVHGTVTADSLEDIGVEGRDVNTNKFYHTGVDPITGFYDLALPPGTFEIRAHKQGYETTPESHLVSLVEGETVSDINFNLTPFPCQITGTVMVGPTPVAEADVWADSPKGGEGAVTNNQGQFVIGVNPGTYNLFVHKEGFYLQGSDPDPPQVSVTLEAPTTTVNFFLAPADSTINVHVESAGNPLQNAHVFAEVVGEFGGGVGQDTDINGDAVLMVGPGDYMIHVDKEGYGHQEQPVSLAQGETVNLFFDLTQADCFFEGRVYQDLDADGEYDPGEEIEGADVWVGGPEGGGGTLTDAQGLYSIPVVSGTYDIGVFKEGFVSPEPYHDITVDTNPSTPYPITAVADFALQPAEATVSGVVTDGLNPIANAHVWAESLITGAGSGTSTDQNGHYLLGLAAGDYLLHLHPDWGTTGLISPDPVPIHLEPGDSLIQNLQFIRGMKHIVGQVTKAELGGTPVAGAIVEAIKDGGFGWTETLTDPNGNYILDVTGGTWLVMVRPDWASESVDWAYIGEPKKVTFSSDDTIEETEIVNLVVTPCDASIKGTVEKPDHTPAENVWVEVRDYLGMGNGAPTDSMGQFAISVPAGTYNLMVYPEFPDLTNPPLEPVSVEPGQTKDVGIITLITKNRHIQGKVYLPADIQVAGDIPIPDVYVHAWRIGEPGWAEAITDINGEYDLLVTDGEWEVMVEIPEDMPYVYPYPPQRAILSSDHPVATIDFPLEPADCIINGQVVDGQGNLLTDLYGFAYAYQGDIGPIGFESGGPIERGLFNLRVPAGTYQVGADFPPGSPYMLSQEVSVTVGGSEPTEKTVTLVVKEPDALITGFIKNQAGDPITGIMAEVFAFNNQGVHQWTPVDPGSGAYNLNVMAGTWNMGVWVEPGQGYMDQPPMGNSVIIEAGQVVNKDFVLLATDSLITGTVLDPSGAPFPFAFVFADTRIGKDSMGEEIGFGTGGLVNPDGTFALAVPAGTYMVGAGTSPEFGYINPEMMMVTVTASSQIPDPLILQFRNSDVQILGQVLLNNQPHEAFIWAWSEKGGSSETYTFDGPFVLNASQDDIWYIGAVTEKMDDQGNIIIYESEEVVVTTPLGVTQVVVGDLNLLPQAALPPPEVVTFNAAEMKTITLSNGTVIRIPAGAIETSGNITVIATPKAKMAHQKGARPIGIGYDLEAINSLGQTINHNFYQDVTITFPYTEAQLQEAGITEDELDAGYWDETSGLWQHVSGVVIDKDNNTVTISVNHFTTFAIIKSTSGDKTAPELTVISPIGGITTYESSILVVGSASDAGSGIASVKVNGQVVSTQAGGFSAQVALNNIGENIITIVAEDKVGNQKGEVLTIIRQSTGGIGAWIYEKIVKPLEELIEPLLKKEPAEEVLAAPVPKFVRDLARERAFVQSWQGLGGRLPTARQIQVAVYGIGRDLAAEIAFVKSWRGRYGRLPTRNEIILGTYYDRDLAAEIAFVKSWQGLGGALPTFRQIQVAVYGLFRDLAAEQAFVRNWGGRFGRLPTRNEIIAGVY